MHMQLHAACYHDCHSFCSLSCLTQLLTCHTLVLIRLCVNAVLTQCPFSARGASSSSGNVSSVVGISFNFPSLCYLIGGSPSLFYGIGVNVTASAQIRADGTAGLPRAEFKFSNGLYVVLGNTDFAAGYYLTAQLSGFSGTPVNLNFTSPSSLISGFPSCTPVEEGAALSADQRAWRSSHAKVGDDYFFARRRSLLQTTPCVTVGGVCNTLATGQLPFCSAFLRAELVSTMRQACDPPTIMRTSGDALASCLAATSLVVACAGTNYPVTATSGGLTSLCTSLPSASRWAQTCLASLQMRTCYVMLIVIYEHGMCKGA